MTGSLTMEGKPMASLPEGWSHVRGTVFQKDYGDGLVGEVVLMLGMACGTLGSLDHAGHVVPEPNTAMSYLRDMDLEVALVAVSTELDQQHARVAKARRPAESE
jgi:hypothetical protein